MKLLKIFLGGVLLVATIAGVLLFSRRDQPVVFALADKGDPLGYPVIAWLNPFRDRSAEMVCESALRALRERDAEMISAVLSDISEGIVAHEIKNQVRSWRVLDSKLSGESATVVYDVVRQSGEDCSPIRIVLRRAGGTWRVAEWEAWY